MVRVFTYRRSAAEKPIPAPDADPFLAWFAAHPYATRAADYADLGVSGLTAPATRAGFGALLAALTEEPADLVLVNRWTDLGRDWAVSVLARQLLAQRGVALLCVRDALPASPTNA